MERVTELADPRRCQGNFAHEQCQNRAEHGDQMCAIHGGKSTALAEQKRLYHLQDAQTRDRVGDFIDGDGNKSLKEEIALLRVMIERQQNLIKTDTDFMQRSGVINSLLLTLEKLLKSSHQLEHDMGNLLSKTTVIRIGQKLCQIVVEELQGIEGYEEIIDRIEDRFRTSIRSASDLETQPLLPGPAANQPGR